MTNRNEIIALANKVGAEIRCDSAGRVSTVMWQGRTYGSGALLSLICFAERARAIAGAAQ